MIVIPGRRQRLAAFLSVRPRAGAWTRALRRPAGLKVSFVDRWEPEEHADLFPELPGATFMKPDVIANFDTDRLHPIADASQDFVICSHVLEHLGGADRVHCRDVPGAPPRRTRADHAA